MEDILAIIGVIFIVGLIKHARDERREACEAQGWEFVGKEDGQTICKDDQGALHSPPSSSGE